MGRPDGKGNFSELSAIMCWSGIEEVQTTVELSLPDWKILTIDESSTSIKLIDQGYETQLDINRQGSEPNPNSEIQGTINPAILAIIRNPDQSLNTDFFKTKSASVLVGKFEDYYKNVFAQVISSEGGTTNGSLPQFEVLVSQLASTIYNDGQDQCLSSFYL
jgi:hypothetical protein